MVLLGAVVDGATWLLVYDESASVKVQWMSDTGTIKSFWDTAAPAWTHIDFASVEFEVVRNSVVGKLMDYTETGVESPEAANRRLQARVRELQEQNEELEREKETVAQQAERLGSELGTARASVVALTSERDVLKRQCAGLQRQMDALSAAVAAVSSSTSSSSSSSRTRSRAFVSSESDSEGTREAAMLRDQVEKLRAELHSKDVELAFLRGQQSVVIGAATVHNAAHDSSHHEHSHRDGKRKHSSSSK